jgi:hypothetical protein
MNKLKLLKEYLDDKYPNFQNPQYPFHNIISDRETDVTFCPSLTPAVLAFLTALNVGYEKGYHTASHKASEEYNKNISDIIPQIHAAGYNQGYAEGYDEGIATEMENSIIPSNAYDLEVFAVRPSQDFESGKQAFIGYKFDLEEQPQFHFTQVEFTAPNLTLKSKINDSQLSAKVSEKKDYGSDD